jgi:hypothetical protein
MLREFPAQAQDRLIEIVGPDAETALVIAELRALGGAWDREPAAPNAVATRGLPYSLLGVAAGPLSQELQLKRSVAELLDGMKPWQGDRRYVNNLAPDEAADAAAIYGPKRYYRLASIKKTYDPANMFRLNHNWTLADRGGGRAAGPIADEEDFQTHDCIGIAAGEGVPMMLTALSAAAKAPLSGNDVRLS